MASVGAAARLAEARAILGGVRDPLRLVWDESASEKDRRLLVAMAGGSQFECGHLPSRCWNDLSAEMRGRVRRGLARFRKWAALLEDGEVLP